LQRRDYCGVVFGAVPSGGAALRGGIVFGGCCSGFCGADCGFCGAGCGGGGGGSGTKFDVLGFGL